jgi:hypothetical protein
MGTTGATGTGGAALKIDENDAIAVGCSGAGLCVIALTVGGRLDAI